MMLIPYTVRVLLLCLVWATLPAQSSVRVLNFLPETGSATTKSPDLIQLLGEKNGWEVVSTTRPEAFSTDNLATYDVVVLNPIEVGKALDLSEEKLMTLYDFLTGGGGFVGIQCPLLSSVLARQITGAEMSFEVPTASFEVKLNKQDQFITDQISGHWQEAKVGTILPFSLLPRANVLLNASPYLSQEEKS
ncbi:MAG: ThuA domain-containing protein, partial [Bacteroidota bacterium]